MQSPYWTMPFLDIGVGLFLVALLVFLEKKGDHI